MTNNEWISVKDSYPPIGVVVVAIVQGVVRDRIKWGFELLFKDVDGLWHRYWGNDKPIGTGCKVTYWMLIPELPEELIC